MLVSCFSFIKIIKLEAYKGGAMGYLHDLSDDFAHLTGHEPEDMKSFLTRNYQK